MASSKSHWMPTSRSVSSGTGSYDYGIARRRIGIPPDGTGPAVWGRYTPWITHIETSPRRLVPPRRDPVRGRYPPAGRPHFFFRDARHVG
jgi:hypothetical protein